MNIRGEITPQKLGELCHMFGINIDQDDLLTSAKALTEQIANGECELVINKDGLFRKVEAVIFKIESWQQDVGKTKIEKIWELLQLYKGKKGTVKRYPGGKIMKGEIPEQALKRELEEELGLDYLYYSYAYRGESERVFGESGSTPGIPKIQKEHFFEISSIGFSPKSLPCPPERLSFTRNDGGKVLCFEWAEVK